MQPAEGDTHEHFKPAVCMQWVECTAQQLLVSMLMPEEGFEKTPCGLADCKHQTAGVMPVCLPMYLYQYTTTA
jgi:hypothetical protein